MILKDLIYAMRNLARNKMLALINVVGLSIGISACLILYLVVSYEFSFDRFQPDRGKIFRVYSKFSGAFSATNSGISSGVASAMIETFSGLEAAVNFFTLGLPVSVPQQSGKPSDFGYNRRMVITDPQYFEVFRYYQWLAGDPKGSLSAPFQVVLTESRARTYFGDVDVRAMIGREIRYQDSLVVHVSGIVRDIEGRTDLDFTDFISASTIDRSWLSSHFPRQDWSTTNSNSQLFIRIAESTTRGDIEAQIPGLVDASKKRVANPDWTATPTLQALDDLHFNPELGIFDGSRSVADKSSLKVLGSIAVLLLLMATFNFINLETAQASGRAREVGVRKVLGSSRAKLVRRFLSESLLLSVGGVLLAIVIAQVAMPLLSEFIPAGVVLDLLDRDTLLFLVSLVILLTLLAGLYPAFVLSSFKPVAALKNTFVNSSALTRTAGIRKGLTVVQFASSQGLIVVTLIVIMQLDFVLNKDLGFTPDAVLELRSPRDESQEKRLLFRHEVSALPGVEAVTLQGEPPTSGGVSSAVMEYADRSGRSQHEVFIKRADTAYLNVYRIKLLAGRNLMPADSLHEYLINETFMRALGFTSPRDAVGITVNGDYQVAGIVRDFHTSTLHSPIKPVAIKYADSVPSFGIRLTTSNTDPDDIASTLSEIESVWKSIYPQTDCEYSFVIDEVQRLYKTEMRVTRLSGMATVIAILISCMGLLGLSSFTVVQRTKEIGIRKVLGATVRNILSLLWRDFLLLVAIALIVSTPVAYLFADRWLQGFTYRIEVNVWIFLASGMLSVLLALITIGFRTLSAARADPVKSLRYE